MPASEALKINNFENSATGRAFAALAQFDSVSDTFVDFTTSLVRDVFRTLIDSSIEQLEAYADLVAKVSGTLQDFEARMVGDTTEFNKRGLSFLNEVVLASFTSITTPYTTNDYITFTPNTNITFEALKLADAKAAFAGITVDYGTPGSPDPKAFEDKLVGALTDEMTPGDLHKFSVAKIRKDVKGSYDKLIMILKLGMQKLVVTDGEIKTSLTFHVDSKDTDELTSTQVQQDYTQKTLNWGVAGGFGGSRKLSGKLSGNIITRSLGGSISGSIGGGSLKTSLKVNVMNEKKTAVTNAAVDITGGVTIHFKSDYFPSVDPAAITP
jgi:hypothetical protein